MEQRLLGAGGSELHAPQVPLVVLIMGPSDLLWHFPQVLAVLCTHTDVCLVPLALNTRSAGAGPSLLLAALCPALMPGT